MIWAWALLAIFACARAHDAQARQDFVAWLQRGGTDLEHLEITDFSELGWGVRTRKPIRAGELILAVPSNLILDTATVERSVVGKLCDGLGAAGLGDAIDGTSVMPRTQLALFLVHERLQMMRYLGVGRTALEKHWWPYLRMLGDEMPSIPLSWSQRAVQTLRGAPTSWATLSQERFLARRSIATADAAFDRATQLFAVVPGTAAAWPWNGAPDATTGAGATARNATALALAWRKVLRAGFYWALAVVTSRSWCSLGGFNGQCRMIPFMHLFNHHSAAAAVQEVFWVNASGSKQRAGRGVIALDEVAPGEQVFISYLDAESSVQEDDSDGSFCALPFAWTFGFIDSEANIHCAYLVLHGRNKQPGTGNGESDDELAKLAGAKAVILAQMEAVSATQPRAALGGATHHVRATLCASSTSAASPRCPQPVPLVAMRMLRVTMLTASELQYMLQRYGLQQNNSSRLTPRHFNVPVSLANELRVCRFLHRTLLQVHNRFSGGTSLASDQRSLATESDASVRVALSIRIGERRAVLSALRWVKRKWKEILVAV